MRTGTRCIQYKRVPPEPLVDLFYGDGLVSVLAFIALPALQTGHFYPFGTTKPAKKGVVV